MIVHVDFGQYLAGGELLKQEEILTTPYRVFIVEDDPTALTVHRSFIENDERIDVIGHADNKVDAIRMATSLEPDVILMDINLTDKDDQHGIDAAIHLSISLPETKIIMLSGILNEDTVRSTMGLGVAVNYLLKSNPEKLKPAIFDAMNGVNQIDGSVIGFILQDYQETLKSTMITLTKQQLKILELFYRGYTIDEVADALTLEKQSVQNYRQSIAKRCLGWKWRLKRLSTEELAQRAKAMGLF